MCQSLIPYIGPDIFFKSYPEQLTPVLETLCRNAATREMLNKVVQDQGKISIYFKQFPSMAEWNWKKKTICLHKTLAVSTYENQLAYLLFEICNAAKTAEFITLSQNKKIIEEFVESFERLEYRSAIKTYKIALEILGKNAEFDLKYVNPDFNHYYALEQISGHAEKIAARYFPGQPYEGTLYHPLSHLTAKQKTYIYSLLFHSFRSTPQEFEERLANLRKLATADASYRKIVDCAFSLFPDYFQETCPPLRQEQADSGARPQHD